MDFLNTWLLTILIFLPTVGAVAVMFANGRDAVRRTALATTIITFALSLLLFATFKWGLTGPYAYAQVDKTTGEYVAGPFPEGPVKLMVTVIDSDGARAISAHKTTVTSGKVTTLDMTPAPTALPMTSNAGVLPSVLSAYFTA